LVKHCAGNSNLSIDFPGISSTIGILAIYHPYFYDGEYNLYIIPVGARHLVNTHLAVIHKGLAVDVSLIINTTALTITNNTNNDTIIFAVYYKY
jgi:hypothetical protein